MNVRLCVISALCFMNLYGCSERYVEVHRAKPADFFLPDVDTLAVTAFNGEGGEEFAAIVVHALKERNFYTIVDRSHTQALLDEQRLLGILPQQAKIKGADAMLTGTIASSSYAESVSHHQQQTAEGETSDIFRRTGRFHFALTVRAISMTTGELLDSRALTLEEDAIPEEIATSEDTPWDRRAPKFSRTNVDALRNKVYARMACDLAGMMAPSDHTDIFTLYDDKRVAGSKLATQAAQEGRWEEALFLFEEGARESALSPHHAKYRARAHHCLSVALTALGRYDEALIASRNASTIYQDRVFSRMLDSILQSQIEVIAANGQVESLARCRNAKMRHVAYPTISAPDAPLYPHMHMSEPSAPPAPFAVYHAEVCHG